MSARKGILLALVTAFFWGTMPLAGKVALDGISPYFITWFRFLSATLALVALLWFTGRAGHLGALRRPPLLMVLAALGLVGNYLLYIVGLQYTTATAAQFLVQMGTVFLVTWSALFLGERVSLQRGAGLALAIGGVLVISLNGESLHGLYTSENLLGNGLVVASALCWSLYAVLQKRLGSEHDSSAVLVVVYATGAVATLPAAPLVPTSASWWALLALLYLAVNTVVAYGAFAESLRHVDAAVTTTVGAFAPVITVLGVACANVILPGAYPGEITAYTLVGGALVLLGVLFVIRSR